MELYRKTMAAKTKSPMPRKLAEVTIVLYDENERVFSRIEGETSDGRVSVTGNGKTLPEDALAPALERAARLLRQQLKENV